MVFRHPPPLGTMESRPTALPEASSPQACAWTIKTLKRSFLFGAITPRTTDICLSWLPVTIMKRLTLTILLIPFSSWAGAPVQNFLWDDMKTVPAAKFNDTLFYSCTQKDDDLLPGMKCKNSSVKKMTLGEIAQIHLNPAPSGSRPVVVGYMLPSTDNTSISLAIKYEPLGNSP